VPVACFPEGLAEPFDKTYTMPTSAWFLACGSKVFYVLLLPFFAQRAKNGNKMVATA
jgi:hypothetical protein